MSGFEDDPEWERIGRTLDGERDIYWNETDQQLFVEGEEDWP